MTALQDKAAVTDRLRRALVAFQAAQTLPGIHRKAKAPASPEERERSWATRDAAVEARQRAAATEVVAAFRAFSAAGLVADAGDWHLVDQARRHLAGGG